jgi:uncharacterized delta-60 repeat protein
MKLLNQIAVAGISLLGGFDSTVVAQTPDSLIVSCAAAKPGAMPVIHTAIPLPDGKILAGGSRVKFLSSQSHAHTNLARINPDGFADDTFNVALDKGATEMGVTCLALQPDGCILVGGDFFSVNGQWIWNLVRLLPNGSVDPQFNAIYLDQTVNAIRLQPDGKILVCGYFDPYDTPGCAGLCRLNQDGSLDTTFRASVKGVVLGIELQPDGKILAKGRFTSIGGQPRSDLARLNSDGSLDAAFPEVKFTGSYVLYGPDTGTLLVQPDGKIVLGGLFTSVNGLAHTNSVRFNRDGTIDAGFNAQMEWRNCYGVQTLALQTDGQLIVGHDSATVDGVPCPTISRINPDGSLDPIFSRNLNVGVAFSSAIQFDGKVLITGGTSTIAGFDRHWIARLYNTGAATQSLQCDGTNLVWLRGGTSPEVWRTSFESSEDGLDWAYLGDGIRIEGGWKLTNFVARPNLSIRARGFTSGGRLNGSCWFVESHYPPTAPIISTHQEPAGVQPRRTGFDLNGSAGSTVVVESSCDMIGWAPNSTNMLGTGPVPFGDPYCTNAAQFYRARLK